MVGIKKQPKVVNKHEYTVTTTIIDETLFPGGQTDNLGEAFKAFARACQGRRSVVRVRGKYGDEITVLDAAEFLRRDRG